METWEALLHLLEGFCALFVIIAVCAILWDIIKAVWHQYRGIEYKMDTAKFLEQEREWWVWAIGIAAVCIGIYTLIPHPWLEKADFRAEIEKDEYTAYYECSYKLYGPGNSLSGDGVVELQKTERGGLLASALYTDYGMIPLGLWMDENEERCEEGIWQALKDGWDGEIKVGELIPDIDLSSLNRQEYMYYGKTCFYCGNVVDSKYIYTTEMSDEVCPVCVYAWYDEENKWGVWKCGRCNTFYEGSKTELSPCPDCGEP